MAPRHLPAAPAALRRFMGLLDEVNHMLQEAAPAGREAGPVCAVYFVTADGLIRTWGEGCRRLYGYEAEEVLGLAAALLDGPDPGTRRARDGRTFRVHLHEAALSDEGGRGMGACRVELEACAGRTA